MMTPILRVGKFRAMIELSREDPGMKDLLDRAEEYFILKGQPGYDESEQYQRGTDQPGPY